MADYEAMVREVLGYKAKHPRVRNGLDPKVLFKVNMFVNAFHSWTNDPIPEWMLRQQGYTDGIVNVDGKNYPLSLLEELRRLKKEHPEYFET